MPPGILFLLILGFLLRIWGIGFGLPGLYHADEPNVINRALAYATGDFNPHYFKIPPLVSYVLFVVYGIYYLVARSMGVMGGVKEFENLFFSDPSSFYLIGRVIMGVLPATATIYALYRLGEKAFSKDLALVSSFLFATNFLHVRDSHYIYLDMPLLLILVSAFGSIFGVLEKRDRKSYVTFGVLMGTAVATKYNGVFIFVPFLAAHLLANQCKSASLFQPRLWVAILIAGAIFGILNPYSVLSFRTFSKDLAAMREFTGPQGLVHHLSYSLIGSLSLPILILSLAGLARVFAVRDPKRICMAFFVLAYYGVLCVRSQPYDRYVLPLIPFLCFFAADTLIQIRKRWAWSVKTLALVTLAVSLPMLARVYLSNRIFEREDVRDVARHWIEENIPEGSRIALDTPFFMPRLKPTLAQLAVKLHEAQSEKGGVRDAKIKKIGHLIEQAHGTSNRRYELYFLRMNPNDEFLFARPFIPYDLKSAKRLGIHYVIVARIKRGIPSVELIEALSKQGVLVARFSPYSNKSREESIDRFPLTGGPFLWGELAARERNGQIIEIYSV